MSGYLDWKVGMKVVCIRDYSATALEEWAVVFGIEFPEIGGIYTIREILAVDPDNFDADGDIGIRLKEILNLPNPTRASAGMIVDREAVFHPDDFRPLQASTTDISSLQALLFNPFVKIGEDA